MGNICDDCLQTFKKMFPNKLFVDFAREKNLIHRLLCAMCVAHLSTCLLGSVPSKSRVEFLFRFPSFFLRILDLLNPLLIFTVTTSNS